MTTPDATETAEAPMLNTDRGATITDRIGRYEHHDRGRMARIVAEVAVEQALGDRVAWACILPDQPGLAISLGKMRWGNQPKQQRRPPQQTLPGLA